MNTIFILILFFSGSGKSMIAPEFTSQEKCESALSQAKTMSGFGTFIGGFCAEK